VTAGDEVRRGDVWWADLTEPRGSEPGHRRPVLVVQADAFNRSRISTILCVVLTSNLRLVEAPGNVLLPARRTGLPRDSAANVSQVITLDRAFLGERIGRLPQSLMKAVETGMRLVLDLV
jgi:mRNA interferase MazF